ncbi:MAG: peptidase MA family metallohydrolase [Bradymonadaceae bacterium]
MQSQPLLRVSHLMRWVLICLVLSFGSLGLNTPDAHADFPPGIVNHLSEEGSLNLHYPPRFRPIIDQIDNEGTVLFHDLERALGLESFPTVDVWVLPNLNLYFEHYELEYRPPRWAIGLSLGKERTVLVLHGTAPGGEPVDVPRTFAHELAHVAMAEASGAYSVPRWLNEGFAVMHAEEWSPERSDLLSRAAATNSLIPFERLDRTFPPHSQSVSLAYAQSFHFVRHLQQIFGDDVFAGILAGVRNGEPFDQAFTNATGASLIEIEGAWRDQLTSQTSLWSIFHDETVVFFGATLLFLVAFLVRRMRKRRQLKSMTDDDDLQGWDYDPDRYPLPGQKS